MVAFSQIPQDVLVGRMSASGVVAMISPTHRGFSTCIIHTPVPGLEVYTMPSVQPWVCVATDTEPSGRQMRLSAHTHTTSYAAVRWASDRPAGDVPLDFLSDDAEVGLLAQTVAGAFAPTLARDAERDAAAAVAEAVRTPLTGPEPLLKRFDSLFDLPEHAERVDHRMFFGPAGPELSYPAHAFGPTSVANVTEDLLVVRPTSGNAEDWTAFAVAWSQRVGDDFGVSEFRATGEELAINVYRGGSAVARAVWHGRWVMVPPPPPGVNELFVEQSGWLTRWDWDRAALLRLLNQPDFPDPNREICRVLGLPDLTPLLVAERWADVPDFEFRTYARSGPAVLAVRRLAAAVGARRRIDRRHALAATMTAERPDGVSPYSNGRIRKPA
jgi:hypothetical protein